MSKAIPLDAVVFNAAIYPRSTQNAQTVARYAEAMASGQVFPAIVLEQDTNWLLDGWHRWQARRKCAAEPSLTGDFSSIACDWHVVPAGLPAKLYAASLSARHGDRIDRDDLKSVARETIEANPSFSMQTVAQSLGVHRETVARWCADVVERRRSVRVVQAVLLSRLGWPQRRIADHLGESQKQVSRNVGYDISTHLTEDILAEALDGLPPEAAAEADGLREEQIFARWTDTERHLLKRLADGETVVVNKHCHGDLIAWATSARLLAVIDRTSPWGNPFVLPDDGDRQTVIANYADHYLPHKPSLVARLPELKGKALACWCSPEPCHGDILAQLAEETP